MLETWVPSLGQEDPLEKEMAAHSSILALESLWMQGPWDRKESDTTERLHFHFHYTKNGLNDQDNPNGIVTHLESDIPECKVKWALGSIITQKASGGDGIPAELLQMLKDDAIKVLYSVCQQIWKIQQWPQDRNRSVFIKIPKKGNTRECSNCYIIALISHASKVMFKIL